MCPACIGSTLLVLGATGAGSAGGLAAIKLRWIERVKQRLASLLSH